ncbi:hypothetical protein [Trichothermofontia sp.]
MEVEDMTAATTPSPPDPHLLASSPAPTLLAQLRQWEQPWRRKAIATLLPLLSLPAAAKLRKTAEQADEAWQELAMIDLDALSDADLRPARIYVGLGFVGFAALMLTLLMLYYHSLCPDLILADQIRQYWYPYIFFVGFGVAGMFMLGREAMRPPALLEEWDGSIAAGAPVSSPEHTPDHPGDR